MDKFPWTNTNSLEEAEFVILGVPDESGSHSVRKGAFGAPGRIRERKRNIPLIIRSLFGG